MSRTALWCGIAVSLVGSVNRLHAQSYSEQPGYGGSAYSVQPYSAHSVPHSAVPPDAMQHAVPMQYAGNMHQGASCQAGEPCYQNSGGGCGCSACAQQPSDCWISFYRNTRWPSPFKIQDINAVSSYFAVQRENGWKMHNTLGHVLFDPATNCVTDAGKNHIRSILSDNPIDRRAIFVLEGATPQHTAERIESVQLAISALVPTGDLPAIYVTDRDAPGSAGAYQTAVIRAMMTTMPAPRLPEFNASQGTP